MIKTELTAGGYYADDFDRPCQNGKIGSGAAADGGAGGTQPPDTIIHFTDYTTTGQPIVKTMNSARFTTSRKWNTLRKH